LGAAELGTKPCEVREDVGLAPQFIGDDRRLGQYRRNYRNAYAATLDCLDGAEGSVASEQNMQLTRL
jgi:hypothetical protein